MDPFDRLEKLYGPLTARSKAGLLPETASLRSYEPTRGEKAAAYFDDLGPIGERLKPVARFVGDNITVPAEIATEIVKQPVRAGEAVGDAIMDPTLGKITKAGAQTALAVGQPMKALGIGGLGLAKALGDDFGVFDIGANAAKKKPQQITAAPQIPGYSPEQQAVFDTAWEKTQRASFGSGVDRRAAEKAVQDGLDFMARNAERKAAADQEEYNRKVMRAEGVRDTELGRQRRFSDTETGKWYEENATWLPFAAAFGGGLASRAFTGPGKSAVGSAVKEWALPMFTGATLSYGAQNAPEIYDFSVPPAVNPEKEAYSKYAFELPEGHPDKERSADYAAGLPAINPIKSAAIESFKANAPARITAAGLEGISLGKLGSGAAGLPRRLINDAQEKVRSPRPASVGARPTEGSKELPLLAGQRTREDGGAQSLPAPMEGRAPAHTPEPTPPSIPPQEGISSAVSDLPPVVIIRSASGRTHHMGDSGRFAKKDLYSRKPTPAKESKRAKAQKSAPAAQEKTPESETAEDYLSDPSKLTKGMWTGGRVGYASGGAVHEPSEAQKQAGNYKKDHIRFQGLEISIENPKGSTRSGVDKGGKSWSVKMPASYGYFKRTEGKDGDHVDCYIGPKDDAENAYVIDQIDANTGKFDEHKVMIGFASKEDALATYRKGFSDGRADDRLGGVKTISVDGLRTWLRSGDTKKPLARKAYATGGAVRDEPIHVGPLNSTVAGRTDSHPISVMAGSYVLPADIISALGEGNTNAGMLVIEQMFPKETQQLKYARGGKVPIAAAGGEFVLTPEQVAAVGGGDIDVGHQILDDWVRKTRAQTIQTLSALPGPAK